MCPTYISRIPDVCESLNLILGDLDLSLLSKHRKAHGKKTKKKKKKRREYRKFALTIASIQKTNISKPFVNNKHKQKSNNKTKQKQREKV